MKLGIRQDRHTNNVDSIADEHNAHPSFQYCIASIDISKEAEDAFALTKRFWKNNGVPIVVLGGGFHNISSGLVSMAGVEECFLDKYNLPSPRKMILTRISFGTGYINENRQGLVDYTDLRRFHINVLAERKFFPEEWDDIIPKQDRWGDPSQYRELSRVTERLHLALRWEKSAQGIWVYDDWNNVSEWDATDNSRKKRLNMNRTTYFRSESYPPQTSDSEKAELKNWSRLLEEEGRKQVSAPLSRLLKKNDPLVQQYGSDAMTLPTIGYDNIKQIFGFLPAITGEERTKMSVEEGTRFLFTDVLDSLLNSVFAPKN